MNIYPLINEYQKMFNDMDELSDEHFLEKYEPSEAVIKVKHLSKIEIENQCIARAKHIKNLEAELSAVADARKGMQKREKSLNCRIEYYKEELKLVMDYQNISVIRSSPDFVIKLRVCPAAVQINDLSAIPKDFLREKIIVEPDKIAIAEMIKSGKPVPGTELTQKTNVDIK